MWQSTAIVNEKNLLQKQEKKLNVTCQFKGVCVQKKRVTTTNFTHLQERKKEEQS